MERYKEIKTITTINEDTNEKEENIIERHYVVKTWGELTDEEKIKEIERNSQLIYEDYQTMIYEDYKYNLEELKEKYKNIYFEDVYVDSNSQGGWVDSIKNFRCDYSINVYGEYIYVDDVDYKIRRYIENIDENDLCVEDYYIDNDTMIKIEKTKKYKEFIKKVVKEINDFINELNDICETIIKEEYNYPSNIHNEREMDFLNGYFNDVEFVYNV